MSGENAGLQLVIKPQILNLNHFDILKNDVYKNWFYSKKSIFVSWSRKTRLPSDTGTSQRVQISS